MSVPRLSASYQPFPQLNSPIAVPNAQGALMVGAAWQRLFIRMWILCGAKVLAQPNAAVIGQTSTGDGAPLAVFDANSGDQLGTLALTNQPGLPPATQLPFSSGDVFFATRDGYWVVSGGEVEVSRDNGITWQLVSLTGAVLPLARSDQMRVSFTQVQPEVTEYPSGSSG